MTPPPLRGTSPETGEENDSDSVGETLVGLNRRGHAGEDLGGVRRGRVVRRRPGRLRVGRAGGGGHVEVLVGARGASLLEDVDGAGAVTRLPVGFGHVAIDHGGGARPVVELGQAQRLLGAPEAAFARRPVAAQDLIAGQGAVGQRQGPAVEGLGRGTLVGAGEAGDFLVGEHCRRLVVAAVGGLHRRHLVGLVGAGGKRQRAGRGPDELSEGTRPAATRGRAVHGKSSNIVTAQVVSSHLDF